MMNIDELQLKRTKFDAPKKHRQSPFFQKRRKGRHITRLLQSLKNNILLTDSEKGVAKISAKTHSPELPNNRSAT